MMMALILVLASCGPETFVAECEVYDLERKCSYRPVAVTFEMKYWREWTKADESECFTDIVPYATSDGLCVWYGNCVEDPPLIQDDPHFQFGTAAADACNALYYEPVEFQLCDEPVLTSWP